MFAIQFSAIEILHGAIVVIIIIIIVIIIIIIIIKYLNVIIILFSFFLRDQREVFCQIENHQVQIIGKYIIVQNLLSLIELFSFCVMMQR